MIDSLSLKKIRRHVRVADVADERHRVAPGVAAVGRLADQHGATRLRGVPDEGQRKADEVRGAVRRERDPRVGRPLVVAAVRRGSPRAGREGRIRHVPGQSAVVAHRRRKPPSATERVPVLLVDADDVRRIGRIDRDPWLQLAVHPVDLAREQVSGDVARRERAGAGRLAHRCRCIRPGRGHPHRQEHEQRRNPRRQQDPTPHRFPSDRILWRILSTWFRGVKYAAAWGVQRGRPQSDTCASVLSH